MICDTCLKARGQGISRLSPKPVFGRWDFGTTIHPSRSPAKGLGVFTCNKRAWLGFNPHFRGFGDEELYIHTKFRQAGHKALCLPFLKWWHRFGRPEGVQYTLSAWNKVRNYVLGHQELGLDLRPVYEHFVSTETHGQQLRDHLQFEHGVAPTGMEAKSHEQLDKLHRSFKIPEADWEHLLADPIRHEQDPAEARSVSTRRDPITCLAIDRIGVGGGKLAILFASGASYETNFGSFGILKSWVRRRGCSGNSHGKPRRPTGSRPERSQN